MNIIDVLRTLYRAETDLELGRLLGFSAPAVSNYRRNGLTGPARGAVLADLLRRHWDVPSELIATKSAAKCSVVHVDAARKKVSSRKNSRNNRVNRGKEHGSVL